MKLKIYGPENNILGRTSPAWRGVCYSNPVNLEFIPALTAFSTAQVPYC